jgi:hypothetical protein
VLLTLLGLGCPSAATLLVTVRGGRGPADPPASHERVDPGGFPVLPTPRGVLHGRGPRPAPGHRRARAVGRRTGPAAVHVLPPRSPSPRWGARTGARR